MATFKERYLAGEIEFEEIDKYSYQWGMSAWRNRMKNLK